MMKEKIPYDDNYKLDISVSDPNEIKNWQAHGLSLDETNF